MSPLLTPVQAIGSVEAVAPIKLAFVAACSQVTLAFTGITTALEASSFLTNLRGPDQ
ncbi:hypothetical protein D9M72_627030 [compost metagenome]